MTWFEETLYPVVGQRFKVERVLFREKTEHQELVIFENPVFGRVLALDGVIQTTEGDEFVYHEMLTHVPILAHGAARRVLIVGGGDGGMLRELLKHRAIERVTMVEIDRAVIDLCARYIPGICGRAFEDPRLDLVIADGCRWVAETSQTFDVIIVDSTDPMGPGEVLFTQEFYADCRRRLTPGGLLVTQNGVPFLQPQELRNTRARMGALFADVACYIAAVPTYYGGFMAFGWGCDDPARRRLTLDEIRPRAAAAALETRYYTPEIHIGAFALPKFVADLVA